MAHQDAPQAGPADAPHEGLPVPRRYWSALTIWLAIFMAVLDGAIANVALPTIAADLRASAAASIWIVNAYQLAITVCLLPLAALGDKIGYRRVYITGLAVFTLETQVRAVRCDEAGASTELNCEIFTRNAYPLLGVAAIAFIGGVWYDALDAGDAADRYNTKHGFTVTPSMMPGPQGLAPGVALSGTF